MVIREKINRYLYDKLRKEDAFWSYDMKGHPVPSEDILIEKTLIHLDIDDINLLFMVYPAKFIKKIWRERLAIQGDYYRSMNILYAWLYFGIKKPEQYLKTIETKHINSLS